MGATAIRVNLGERSYDLIVTNDDRDGVGPFARERVKGGTQAFIVTDEHVARHAGSVAAALTRVGFQIRTAVRPAGEGQKSLAVAAELYDQMVDFHADRRTLVVAVGGGVVGDLAGYVAATFNRGVPLLMVPTTLLAMVDSSVGGKVAVNHPRAKNLIGTFHQPAGVWIDTAMLATLPERDYKSGLAEVVKYGVILDPELFRYLETNTAAILQKRLDVVRHIVTRCCKLKADIVERDEREESGLRAMLNYGHTFAHAFETAAGYGAWLHGEAVAAGMVCASRLAERRGLIQTDVTLRQLRLLEAFGLPTAPGDWPPDRLIETMRSDKKALGGKLRFILPTRLGEVALFDDVPEADVRAVLSECPQDSKTRPGT
jgi:3-dehydroquinate synthase